MLENFEPKNLTTFTKVYVTVSHELVQFDKQAYIRVTGAIFIRIIEVYCLRIFTFQAGRIECCDVEYVSGNDSANVKLRPCMKGEIVA